MGLLEVRDLTVRFGGVVALDRVTFTVDAGRMVAVIGPNGAGKTTLFNIITRVYRPAAGTVLVDGKSVQTMAPHQLIRHGVARTFQNLALFRGMTVLENILLGRHIHMRAGALSTLFYWVWALRNEVANRRIVEELIDFMQLQDIRDEPVETIPLGLQKRVELARALAAEPKLLILDEPMAGMNQEEKEYIARFILDAREERNTTVLLIEHHMDVVTSLCDRVMVLSYGESIAQGEPKTAIADPRVVSAYLGQRAAARHVGAAA